MYGSFVEKCNEVNDLKSQLQNQAQAIRDRDVRLKEQDQELKALRSEISDLKKVKVVNNAKPLDKSDFVSQLMFKMEDDEQGSAIVRINQAFDRLAKKF